MSKSLPPLTWFRSFEAAARTLSFTAAAEEIGLTQSAVSQQVKSLEMRLHVPLFVRQPRGLALTDDGRRLLPQVSAALEALSTAAQTAAGGSEETLLTVATSVSVAQWVISPRLPEFTALFPDIRLRFLSAIWPDDFHSSRADVEIRFGSDKQVGKNAIPLRPDRLIAVKSPDLTGAFETLPLIESVGTSSGWRSWAETFGGSWQAAFYVDTYGMALQLAAHGNGVALISEWLAGHALETGMVARAAPETLPCQEGYSLSLPAPTPAAQAFQEWVLHTIEEDPA